MDKISLIYTQYIFLHAHQSVFMVAKWSNFWCFFIGNNSTFNN